LVFGGFSPNSILAVISILPTIGSYKNMKHPLLIASVLTVTALAGCDSADLSLPVSSPDNTPQNNTNPLKTRLPNSLLSQDNGSEEDASTPQNGNELARTTADALEANASLELSHTQPAGALMIDSYHLNERLEFARARLTDIDTVWAQIVSYCSSVSDAEICAIPAGTLSGNSEMAPPDDDQALLIENVVTQWDAEVAYTRNPDDNYDHKIVFNQEFSASDSATEEYQWNADRSRILVRDNGQWQFDGDSGSYSSQFLYANTDNGDEISLVEESSDTVFEHKLAMQLRELGDSSNGVEIKSQTSWAFDTERGTSTSTAVANDDGGKTGSTSTFIDSNGVEVNFHTRETFDAEGSISSAEYCSDEGGADCSTPENWTVVDLPDTDDHVMITLEGDEAILDIELVGGESMLDGGFAIACTEMGLPEDECAFEEMMVLPGTEHEFEDLQDSLEGICEALAIAEEDCQMEVVDGAAIELLEIVSGEADNAQAEQGDN
jgi:hypothetical protein